MGWQDDPIAEPVAVATKPKWEGDPVSDTAPAGAPPTVTLPVAPGAPAPLIPGTRVIPGHDPSWWEKTKAFLLEGPRGYQSWLATQNRPSLGVLAEDVQKAGANAEDDLKMSADYHVPVEQIRTLRDKITPNHAPIMEKADSLAGRFGKGILNAWQQSQIQIHQIGQQIDKAVDANNPFLLADVPFQQLPDAPPATIAKYKLLPVSAATTTAEKLTDMASQISAFAFSLKMLPPGLNNTVKWAAASQISGGDPMTGAYMEIGLGWAGRLIPAQGLLPAAGRATIVGGGFGTMAAIQGGDTKDILINAGIPAVFEMFGGGMNWLDSKAKPKAMEAVKELAPELAKVPDAEIIKAMDEIATDRLTPEEKLLVQQGEAEVGATTPQEGRAAEGVSELGKVIPPLAEASPAIKEKAIADSREVIKQEVARVQPDLMRVGGAARDTEAAKAAVTQRENPAAVSDMADNVEHDLMPEPVATRWERLKGWAGSLTGKTMPRTTLANREAGEAGAKYLSARVSGPLLARSAAAKVLEGGVDENVLGAVLTEDNLRSIAQDKAARGDDSPTLTLVGEGRYFPTEEAYQAAMSDPLVKEGIARHQETFSPQMDEMFRQAQNMAPDEELPTRGLQTGARINLKAILEGETVPEASHGNAGPRGNPLGTLQRKTQLARQAKGTGQAYDINYRNIVANSYAKMLDIASYNEYVRALEKSGLAVIGKPGQIGVEIGGQPTEAFPLRRRTVIINNEGQSFTVPQDKTIYLRRDLAKEFRGATNIDAPLSGNLIRQVNRTINWSAIAGLTDATAHSLNLTTFLLTRPGIGGDSLREAIASTGGFGTVAVVSERLIAKAIAQVRGDLSVQERTGALAEIGAMRQPHEGTKWYQIGGRALSYYDRLTRLVADDGFSFLVEKGLAEDTPTARREYINQVGQYNRRAQPPIMRALKDSGVSPFIVAGKSMAVLHARLVSQGSGVKATGNAQALALRGMVMARMVGTLATVQAINYMITGQIGGRKGTPWFAVDTGKDDENGKPIVVDIAGRLFGYTRAARMTGIKSMVTDLQNGLTPGQAVNDGLKDISNSLISPVAGPPVRFAVGALTGHPTAVGFPRQYPAVPPGQSQMLSDFEYAMGYSNPVSSGYLEGARRHPGDWLAQFYNFANRQLPGVLPKTGTRAETLENLPHIVNAAQLHDYIDWSAREARQLPQAERLEYLFKQKDRIDDPLLQVKFLEEALRKGVLLP